MATTKRHGKCVPKSFKGWRSIQRRVKFLYDIIIICYGLFRHGNGACFVSIGHFYLGVF
jgi:hypothetical protein